LSADVLSSKILSKKAKEAQEALEVYRETIKNEEILDELDEFAEHLDEVADLDLMATRKIGNLGGKVATETQIRRLRGYLKKKGINLILEGDIKNALNQFKPIVINGNKFDSPKDLFRFMKDNDFVGGFNAETKQFILPRKLIDVERKIYQNPTEIVLFHETKHFEHFEEIGEIAYSKLNTLQKETYVWNKILAKRGKWTNDELKESLEYINRIRTEPRYGYNLKPLTIK
jgi:Metallopeptidase toxin 4